MSGFVRLLAIALIVSPLLSCSARNTVAITTPSYRLEIVKDGFRYRLVRPDGSVILPAHARAGLEFGGGVAVKTVARADGSFEVTNDKGRTATVTIETGKHFARFSVKTGAPGKIVVRTGGAASPAFGLADHAAIDRTTTDVTGFSDEQFRAQEGPGDKRMVSNFIVFPRQGVAFVNMETGAKVVRVTDDEAAQGVASAREMPALYYFVGTPAEIYAAFLQARQREGHPLCKPKYELYGVGWEAFGALGWNTNEKTVTENVERYLTSGYPLKWMVVGSGFWPNEDPKMRATTSFGLWDKVRYPDPKRFVGHFKAKGLKFLLGLRIAFIKDGPYSAEGVAKNFFLKEDGRAKAYKVGFPNSPVYLLDGSNPDAVKWYAGLCQKWMAAGVDGFKEDLFHYGDVKMRDGNIDAVNRALMDKGVFVMGRNNYLGSACDTHRIEDFNFDQNQDRGPINCLAFSYSGLPFAYPDIVGGTFGEGRKMPPLNSQRMKKYMMRAAQFGSVCPSMAVGMGPWSFDSAQVQRVMLAAARLHDELLPYIYSAAIDAHETGFPWTMAPLPLVFPDDPQVYGRENATVRGYQWMFGPSLLACPLYGDDYWETDVRDVYLPAGQWMDYDTGETYRGPALLDGFRLPPGKTPLFVGGKGVLIVRDRKGNSLRAKVYSIAAYGSAYRFTHSDGTTHTTITNANTGWSDIEVTDTTASQSIRFERETKPDAIRFAITPGHDYQIKDKR